MPQANRSLRLFNMYLNTRTLSPLALWFSRRADAAQPASQRSQAKATAETPTAPETPRNSTAADLQAARTPPRRTAMPSIPPTTNPRGEIIFSTHVSAAFRQGYERYRAAFERKRREKLNAQSLSKQSRLIRWLRALRGDSGAPSDKVSEKRHHKQ